jgi:hypothetical protein
MVSASRYRARCYSCLQETLLIHNWPASEAFFILATLPGLGARRICDISHLTIYIVDEPRAGRERWAFCDALTHLQAKRLLPEMKIYQYPRLYMQKNNTRTKTAKAHIRCCRSPQNILQPPTLNESVPTTLTARPAPDWSTELCTIAKTPPVRSMQSHRASSA